MATRCGRRPACGACRGASACRWHASYEPTEAAAETSPSAPATKPAETLGFRRFPFFHVLYGYVVHLGSDFGVPHLSAPTAPLSSTQNAPDFGCFRLKSGAFFSFSLFSCCKIFRIFFVHFAIWLLKIEVIGNSTQPGCVLFDIVQLGDLRGAVAQQFENLA